MVYSSKEAMSIRGFLIIELHFEMDKDIPIKNDGNDRKLRDNDENIQYEGYLGVESANLWERNTINMITIIAGLLTILNNLNDTVYSRKYNHKN